MTLRQHVIKTIINVSDTQSCIEKILNHDSVSHKQKVRYALLVASDLEYYDTNKYPEIKTARQQCLKLVADWLLDKKSVSNEQFGDAAIYAIYAANAATYTANAANAAAVYETEIKKHLLNLIILLECDCRILRIIL